MTPTPSQPASAKKIPKNVVAGRMSRLSAASPPEIRQKFDLRRRRRNRTEAATNDKTAMPKLEGDECCRCLSRRSLLKHGGTGVVAVLLGTACDDRPLVTANADGEAAAAAPDAGGAGTDAGGVAPACPRALAAGNAAAFAVGTLRLVNNVAVGRDGQGLYAMSAVCTHQGCLVQVLAGSPQDSLVCPCHGSAFDGNGAVTRGPARTPLQHFEVEVAADGAVTVCPGTPVPSSTRVLG
jgi:Rieske Fe-S protein